MNTTEKAWMRRGYRRERKDAPLDVQDKAMREADVTLTGTHPPIYTDLMKDTGHHKPLVDLAKAIGSLRNRDADELVVYDAATVGRNHKEIIEAMAAIGRTGCKLIVWRPTPREYVWHPDAAEIIALAAEGETILRSAKGKVASGKTRGAAPKLVGAALETAKAAWADPNLTARQAAAKVLEVSGVHVSMRLMFAKLGHKSVAETRLLKPRLPKPVSVKKKASARSTKKRS
jgi:hypothetical protein